MGSGIPPHITMFFGEQKSKRIIQHGTRSVALLNFVYIVSETMILKFYLFILIKSLENYLWRVPYKYLFDFYM